MPRTQLGLALSFLFALIILTGCGNSARETGIVGSWQQTSASGSFLHFVAEQLEFHSDGTFYAPGMWNGTYSLSDEGHIQLTAQLANAPLESVTYQLTLSDDTLQLRDEGTGVALEFRRTGPPSEVLPPTLQPSASTMPSR